MLRRSDRLRHRLTVASAVLASLWVTSYAVSQQETDTSPESDPLEIKESEAVATSFSIDRAAGYLDRASLSWQKKHRCGTCHTNFAYLVARPSVLSVSTPLAEVRDFIEDMVEKRWEEKGPRWPAEVVVAATTLAMNDRGTTGRLHPTTRRALDRMWSLQQEDGGWEWLECGWPPMESDAHYGATLAALGVALAPGGYAGTASARKGLDGIRRYLKSNPAPSLHHRAMVLWASLHVDGLMDAATRKKTIDDLVSLQRPDGGWALGGLLAGWDAHKRKDGKEQETSKSDGYGTAFVLYVLRRAGISHEDAGVRRAVDWLKRNQRQSGRWFTRSPTRDNKHFISNFGTAFAVMALKACGEVYE